MKLRLVACDVCAPSSQLSPYYIIIIVEFIWERRFDWFLQARLSYCVAFDVCYFIFLFSRNLSFALDVHNIPFSYSSSFSGIIIFPWLTKESRFCLKRYHHHHRFVRNVILYLLLYKSIIENAEHDIVL